MPCSLEHKHREDIIRSRERVPTRTFEAKYVIVLPNDRVAENTHLGDERLVSTGNLFIPFWKSIPFESKGKGSADQ
jgi:hypothetical protein